MSDRLAKQVADELREIADLAGTPGVHTNLGVDFISALAELVEAGEDVGVYGEHSTLHDDACDRWDEALSRVAESLGITTTKETR